MTEPVDARANEMISIGDGLFARKLPVLSLWQTLSEQFDPDRADYTWTRSIGMEFYAHLMTGVGPMASRDLANSISAMLRPPGQTWFHARTQSESINRDQGAKIWLDWATEQQRQIMYHNLSGWSRASKECDRDFVVIGNGCINVRPNTDYNGLVYRTIHMRDVAWDEDPSGRINVMHVKRRISKRNLVTSFPDTVAPKVKNDVGGTDPHGYVSCRHIVMPSSEYDSNMARHVKVGGGEKKRTGSKLPFVSIWVDCDNQVILEEIGQYQLGYIPPRWETKPGFGYGYSPAAGVAISDARMLQQITLTLLEAGQKAVDPPYKAVGEAIQGGVNTFAGGITWVDAEYDEKTGAALEPLFGGQRDLGWGVDREKRIADLIAEAHYLNQIKFPDTSKARTAYETQKMWQEFIRTTRPLFEPIQAEYNGEVCNQSFEMLLRMGVFGGVRDMPQILQGRQVIFTFDDPLTQAATAANAQSFTSVGQLYQLGSAIDPTIRRDLDIDTMFRDAVEGTGAPSRWLVPKAQADAQKAQDRQQAAQQQQMQTAMGTAGAAADTATKVGNAATQLQQGGVLPPQQPQTGGAM